MTATRNCEKGKTGNYSRECILKENVPKWNEEKDNCGKNNKIK